MTKRNARPTQAVQEAIDLGALVADPANRRTHPDRNLAMVKASLEHVGAARSIVIDEDDVILAGNGVTRAAVAAGITSVRVIESAGDELIAVRRRGLTPEQKRALALYDNRTAELAEWNYEQLSADKDAGLEFQPFWTDAEEAIVLGTPTKADWNGMPEFDQADATAFRTIKIHFATQAAVDAFAALLDQPVTDKTRYLWYPRVEPESVADLHYTAPPEVPAP
jgi:hypothetical protein